MAGLMLWHFFLPVNATALVVFAGSATTALIMERRWFISVFRLSFSRPFAAGIAAFAVWTANHAVGSPYHFPMDDYLYEFATVRWFHDYRIIPGLANLHPHLGLNNSHHLFAAMLSEGPWRGTVNHIFNGFFIVLTCGYLFDAARDLAKRAGSSPERLIFRTLLLCPCVGVVLFGFMGSMLPTLKADVFVCAATALLACVFLEWSGTPADTSRSAVLSATILVIGCLIPAVRVSALVFCAIIVGAVALRSFTAGVRERRAKRLLAGSVALSAVLTISFPIRGIVLSGYPFYPWTALSMNVDWRVPFGETKAMAAFITSCARLTSFVGLLKSTEDGPPLAAAPTTEIAPGWSWVGPWARSTAVTERMNIGLPLVLTVICIPLFFARRPDTPDRLVETPAWAYLTLIGASAAALTAWFIQAPAGRFAIVNFWIVFAAMFSWATQRLRGRWIWSASLFGLVPTVSAAGLIVVHYFGISSGIRLWLMLALLAFAALWILAFGLLRRTANYSWVALLCVSSALYPVFERAAVDLMTGQSTRVASILWTSAQSARPFIPTPILRYTCSGLGVYDALASDFETPLPNTLFFNRFLVLRGTRIPDGFRNSAGNNPYCGAQRCASTVRDCPNAQTTAAR